MGGQGLRTDIVSVDGIGAAERQAWNGFRAQNRALASPYFSLEFTKSVARRRLDTRIAILHQNGTIAGFLPLHLSRSGVARPIGGAVCMRSATRRMQLKEPIRLTLMMREK